LPGPRRSRPGKALATRMGVFAPKRRFRTPRPIPSDFDAPIGPLRAATRRNGHNRKQRIIGLKGRYACSVSPIYNAQRNAVASPAQMRLRKRAAGIFRRWLGGGELSRSCQRVCLRIRLDGRLRVITNDGRLPSRKSRGLVSLLDGNAVPVLPTVAVTFDFCRMLRADPTQRRPCRPAWCGAGARISRGC
jgi:hypothetical protein